ncbi:MAG: hypothetical protein GW762_05385 [Candidatus Pacebacteria bacterium]|nr:hypothetical protein [Candidatus Paceibacterota bacterium]
MAGRNILKLFFSKKSLVIFITVLAFFARFWKIEFVPFQNDADELAFVFAGQSLIEEGVPISWSSFEYDDTYIYSNEEIGDPEFNTDGTITLIKPWFDHPYLLSLIEGAWTEALGYRFPSTPPSLILRLPMLAIAMITLFLFWKIVSELYSERTAVITYFLFALSPSIILGQRMVIGENIVVPLLLAAVLILVKQKEKYYGYLPFLAAAALLAKMTGIIVLLVLGLAFLLKRDWKRLVTVVASSLLLFLVFYLPFVYSLGWNEFIAITSKQSFRLLGWVNPAFIMATPGFHHYLFYDLSYYVFLFLGIAGLLVAPKNKQALLLQFASLGALLLLWSTSAEQDALGWYKLPFFTLLAISVGYVLEKLSLAVIAMLGSLVVTNNFGLVRFVEHPYPTTEKLRLVVSSLVLIPVIGYVFMSKQFQKKFVYVAIAIIGSVYAVQSLYLADSFYDAQCQHIKCPIPTITTTVLLKEFIR